MLGVWYLTLTYIFSKLTVTVNPFSSKYANPIIGSITPINPCHINITSSQKLTKIPKIIIYFKKKIMFF